MRTLRKILVTAGAVIASAVLLATPAEAATTLYSTKAGYGPYLGISYQNQAGISTNSIMTGFISIFGSKTIPGGYSGGQASIYRNGALCSSAALYYYPNATTSWSGGTTIKNCGSGNYTTRGSTGAYNGNGYNYFYTNTTPILQH